jgi:hypothetical protein
MTSQSTNKKFGPPTPHPPLALLANMKIPSHIKTSLVFTLSPKVPWALFTLHFSQQIYHVGYTSSHLNTEVKQQLLGWETLQGIPGSAGAYPPADRVQSFQTLFVSIKQLRPAETKKKNTSFSL